MFDLIAFIRQYLTPTLRQPIIIGLCRVLLSPLMSVYTAVMQARNDVLSTANSTGQVAVLEDILNQATFGSGVGAVYLIEGDQVNYDFQVVTPAGLPLDVLTRLNALVRAHKLAGKRFVIQNQVTYEGDHPVTGQSVSWVPGFPYMANGILHFALNERGDFHVKISAPTFTLVDSDYTFNGPATENTLQVDDPTLAYTIQIINLSKTVSQQVTAPPTTTAPVTRMGYSRFADSHQTSLWFILTRSMRCTISLVSGSASGDGWQTGVARIIDSTQTLREWTSGLRVNPTANGQGGIVNVTYYITISELDGTAPVTYAWTPQSTDTNGIIDIALNPTTIPVAGANRAPVVANALSNPTITDAGDQAWDVPVNTFSDPDGNALTLSAAANGGGGLPTGITFSPQNRRFSFAGTLANGTYNLQLTATDPYGASVTDAFSVTISRAAVVAPITGTFDVVYADDSNGYNATTMMQLTPTWRTDSNGKNWCTLHDSATPNVPTGYTKYYLIDEDGVPNASMGWNPWTGALADFGEFPENYVAYIQVIIAKGTNFVDYPGANNNYKAQCGFAQVFTGTKSAPVANTQRLKFSLQQVSSNDPANDGFGTIRYQHEPSIDGRPPVYFPNHIANAKAAGMNSVGIYSKRGDYQISKTVKGRTVQRDNQLAAIVNNDLVYTWRGTIGLAYNSPTDNGLSDLMSVADVMKNPDGSVSTNQNCAMPRLCLLRDYIEGNQTSTTNPFAFVKQYIIDDVTAHLTHINSGRCEAIGYTLGYRWEDTFPGIIDGAGVYAFGDYDPNTIADFKRRKNTTYTPTFDGGNRGRNSFAGADGRAWYKYLEDDYILLKDWIADVIHSIAPNARVVTDFGQFVDGDVVAAHMINWPRMSQKAGQIKVNPDFDQSPWFVADLVRSTGKRAEMETDNGRWYQLSATQMTAKLRPFFQAGFAEVQFGQCGDEATHALVCGYASDYLAHYPLGPVATIATNGSGTFSASGQLSGNQDTTNLWTLAGGSEGNRIDFVINNDL